ncbi:hypothetical protein CANCADRAFT_106571 [Tortispora caseinolytica NRRL Y-17796]|uniref:Major facilitator superfamily (MFS) profile domain-containing protein n=1 Tax=Tortispora caseinolytica NRRL Y-17796 TaxID=767744 RepID=A0A1E4TF92_9ASCO|nr:hypothetical protein CANCADRAFT_106571 [Tortispora caseinolytica NRRL Y-17796]
METEAQQVVYEEPRASTSDRLPSLSNDIEKSFSSSSEDPFLVDFTGPNDPENPLNFPLWLKWSMLVAVSFLNFLVVLYSTSFQSGLPGLAADFNIHSTTVLTLGLTLYMLGIALGTLLFAPLSEIYGRRPVYMFTSAALVLCFIPVALAPNFALLCVFRFLAGFFGSCCITNGGATISDTFGPEHRHLAVNIYFICPLLGPVIGPIYGGFVFEALGWRWMVWIIAIATLVLAVLFYFVMKETYAPTLIERKKHRIIKQTGDHRYHSVFDKAQDRKSNAERLRLYITRPIMFLLMEPISIFFALWVATVYGIFYLSFVAYPIVFGEYRHWSAGFVGLSFLGVGTGLTLCFLCNPIMKKLYMRIPVNPESGMRPPEARLYPVLFTALLAPISLYWFAWTSQPSVHWIVPIIAGIPFGFSNTTTYIYSSAYLIDAYGVFSASALGANAVFRSIFGAAFPLFASIMYHNLGSSVATTILASISLLVAAVPFVFFFFGKRIRASSPYCGSL